MPRIDKSHYTCGFPGCTITATAPYGKQPYGWCRLEAFPEPYPGVKPIPKELCPEHHAFYKKTFGVRYTGDAGAFND